MKLQMKWRTMSGKMYKKILFIFALILFSGVVFANDTMKDTDLDGVSDAAEISTYKTDPNSPDTDQDGVLDYQEILDNTDPNDPFSNSIVLNTPNANDFKGLPVLWMVGRIAGISSFIMFTLVIIMGLTMTSKILIKYRIIPASDVMQSHQFTATFIAITLLIVHFTSFMFDDFIRLKIPEIVVPFILKRDLISAVGLKLTLPVGLGIIAFYIALTLLVTSNFKNKIISAKNWRIVHYLSFLFFILFLLHAILSGSDSDEPWMIIIYVVCTTIVLTLVLLRIFGKKYFLDSARKKADKNKADKDQSLT